jgi:hypothetical protein
MLMKAYYMESVYCAHDALVIKLDDLASSNSNDDLLSSISAVAWWRPYAPASPCWRAIQKTNGAQQRHMNWASIRHVVMNRPWFMSSVLLAERAW